MNPESAGAGAPLARPDPDALLARVEREEREAVRGRLRIYFGASAGVGKTYAMLAGAQRLRSQGVDVVIGVVETHGRAETQKMAEALERLPLRSVEYRGRTLAEFDLDGALRRHPQLILVDEMAHNNLEGSRHAKRWQDIDELLAAGIDVHTTINVQHLETLNDAVGGITGIRVWETVPDRVFDQAHEVVLVDVTPEELLQRLKEGKVYLPQQAERAVRNFFRKGNLIALRELALRRTADRVDVEMLQYRRDQSVGAVWQTRDSLLACVAPGTQGERVIRAAAREATRLEIPWHAVAVEDGSPMAIGSRRHLQEMALLNLAQSLGAESAGLAGDDAVAAVVRYARDHNLTRVMLGRTDRTRWPWQRPFADRLARAAPDLEIITAAAAGPARSRVSVSVAAEDRPPADWRRYAWSVLACALTALVAAPVSSVFELPNIVMLFLLTVVLVAVRLGRGPAVLAAFLSVAEFDFFFVPPRFSFAVSDVQYLLTFAVMLVVALIAGQLTAGLQLQARAAHQRAERVRALYELARDLSGALLPMQIADISARFMRAQFDAHAQLMLTDDSGRVYAPPATGEPDGAPAADPGIAQWVVDHVEPAGLGTGTLAASPMLYLPLKAPMRVRGLLAVHPVMPARLLGPEAMRLLDTVARLVAIALERIHYVEVAQQSTLQMESERLRNSLLSAVSHDLRTPLAALVALAESLQAKPAGDAGAVTAGEIGAQARRLHALVENLLDMARLQEGRVALDRQWHSLEEVVGTGLRAMAGALGTRTVTVDLPADLPLVEMDAPLMERVLCNLLENAAKFTPPTATIAIGAAWSLAPRGAVTLWVQDDGPGLPPGREEEIFKKFERGNPEGATPGVGLGLAICRAIVEAHGGSIRAENRSNGGARFTMELPLRPAPAVPGEHGRSP